MTQRRAIVVAVILVLMGYFILLPWFWAAGAPSAHAAVPESWPHSKDLPIRITTRAWHNNFQVTQVRFFADHTQTSFEGLEDPLYPFMLHEESAPRTWPVFQINRFTFPRSRTLEVTVPFGRLAAENKVAPGVVAGYLDISYTYTRNLARPNVIA